MIRIAICGAHLTPALALIEKLEKRDRQIIFFGRKYATEGAKNYSAEYRIIQKKKNITFLSITTGRLQRKFTRFTIPSLLKIPIGVIQSFFYLLKYRPRVVVSFGGYLSLPVVFCAWLVGIDSLVHEQSAMPGLANRISSFFARKIFLTWRQTLKFFPKEKTKVIGNLTRAGVFKKSTPNSKIQKFLDKDGRMIFVTGGNQGSHFLNRKITDLLPKLGQYLIQRKALLNSSIARIKVLSEAQVLIFHQVGTANFEGDLDKARKIASSSYFAADYLGPDEIGAVLARADLVIARSGANTVWDLGVAAKVAILIPLPISASGEQEVNAKILENAGSAIVILQHDASEASLEKAITRVFQEYELFKAKAKKFSQTLPQTAAQSLAQEISL